MGQGGSSYRGTISRLGGYQVARESRGVKESTSNAEKKLRRHQDIVGLISASSKKLATRQIFERLGEKAGTLRTLQRDLRELEEVGRIEEDGDGWVACGPRVEQLERLLSLTALQTFKAVLQESLPTGLRQELQSQLRKHEAEIDRRIRANSPEIEWLKALRIDPGYGWYEQPVIDYAVRKGIEEAISLRRKAWMKVKPLECGRWHYTNDPVLVTISHFSLTLPDRPAVKVWFYEDPFEEIGERGPQRRSTVWPLEFIESVEVCNEAAEIVPDWQPVAVRKQQMKKPDAGWESYVLRVNFYVIEMMTGTRFLQHLLEPSLGGGLIGTDDEGWGVYRIRVPAFKDEHEDKEWGRFDTDFRAFLQRFPGDIEILEPYEARHQARNRAIDVLNMYLDAQEEEFDVRDELWDRES